MTRSEYINQLRKELSGLPLADVNEIIRDQEEYISDAIQSGRAEPAVIQSLGSAQELAKELKAGHQIKTATVETKLISKTDKVFKAILAACVLAPFNLIIVLGPFVALCCLLIALWSVAASGVAVGLAGIGVSFFVIPAGLFFFLTFLFGSLTLVGVSLLSLVACYYVTLEFMKLTLKYLKWNIKFMTGENV